MVKPATFDGYSDQNTIECERVPVTLLRGLGPWKESVFRVGGLTPRYLVTARPPEVPARAGTLEENLRAMWFERSMNERGQRPSWWWQTGAHSVWSNADPVVAVG